jgi:hypothetical protein|tara:strand:- start:965 stop:1228 length:264 start_codon:yes stop_codon:yes gene_type:complete
LARYELTLEKNVVTNLVRLDDDDEEMLGLEWALTEIKESFSYSGDVSTFFTLADENEVDEILDFLDGFFGDGHDAGVAAWRDFREKL